VENFLYLPPRCEILHGLPSPPPHALFPSFPLGTNCSASVILLLAPFSTWINFDPAVAFDWSPFFPGWILLYVQGYAKMSPKPFLLQESPKGIPARSRRPIGAASYCHTNLMGYSKEHHSGFRVLSFLGKVVPSFFFPASQISEALFFSVFPCPSKERY